MPTSSYTRCEANPNLNGEHAFTPQGPGGGVCRFCYVHELMCRLTRIYDTCPYTCDGYHIFHEGICDVCHRTIEDCNLSGRSTYTRCSDSRSISEMNGTNGHCFCSRETCCFCRVNRVDCRIQVNAPTLHVNWLPIDTPIQPSFRYQPSQGQVTFLTPSGPVVVSRDRVPGEWLGVIEQPGSHVEIESTFDDDGSNEIKD